MLPFLLFNMKIEEVISQRSFKSIQDKTLITLLFTASSIQNHLTLLFKEKGLTQQQFNVLRILRGSFPKPISTKCIRERMIDKMSDTPKIVERLEKKNLVIKNINADDKRLVDVLITDEGKKVLAYFDDKVDSFEYVFKNLKDDELSQLTDLLQKIECKF